MRKILICLIVTFSLAHDLEQIIKLAQNSNLANISKINTQISSLKEQVLKSSYMPSLNLEGGFVYASGDKSVLTPKKLQTISANIEFILYDGGKREALFESLARISRSEFFKNEDRLNFIALSVTKLYFKAFTIDGLMKSKQNQVEFLSSLNDKLEHFYNAGLTTVDEYEMVAAKLNLAKAQMLNLEHQKRQILNDMTLLTGADIVLRKKSQIKYTGTNAQNSEILALENQLFAAIEDIKVANSNIFPTFFVKNSSTFYNAKYDNDYSSFGVYQKILQPYKDQVFRKNGVKNEVVLGFKWNVFDFQKTKKEREIKQIIANQASLNLEQRRIENNLKIKNLKSELDSLNQSLKAQKTALKAAQSAFNAVYKKYNAGLASYTDMLSALSQKFDILALNVVGENEIEIKKAEILYENGEDILKKVIND